MENQWSQPSTVLMALPAVLYKLLYCLNNTKELPRNESLQNSIPFFSFFLNIHISRQLNAKITTRNLQHSPLLKYTQQQLAPFIVCRAGFRVLLGWFHCTENAGICYGMYTMASLHSTAEPKIIKSIWRL